MLAESPTGELVVSQEWEGRVTKLADRDGDGVADDVVPILTGRSIPHGLAFAGDVLFVAEKDRVLRLDVWWDGTSAREIIRLPGGGQHETRSLAVGPDGKLYVSIGSTCDACSETDPLRAAVWRYALDGGGGEPYARGLRNAVGLAWELATGHLWATENGRNDLGDTLPPDEVDLLRPGADYGWPGCFGQRQPAPGAEQSGRCEATEPATVELPAHIAPLGLAFYEGPNVLPAYRGDLLVAEHGSALLQEPIGHSVIRIPMRDGQPQAPVDFIKGWLADGISRGRPVGPFVARDGTLYLTDDENGVIYHLRREASAS
jgi:glucose/arabinose dehydrogenase